MKKIAESDIHISIVSHNQLALVKHILRDLDTLDSKDRFQITLTLNIQEVESIHLTDFSFPVKLIENSSPKGFGDNHNQAYANPIYKQERHYFFVVNPDVRLNEDVFSVLVSDLKNNDKIGVVAPLVINYDGEVEDSFRKIPTPWKIVKKFFGISESNHDLKVDSGFFSDWVAGMFMGFRSEVFELLNGFDANYFLYYEDVELCSRIWLSNYAVWINPEVSIIHNGQRDSHRNIKYFLWHLQSMKRFFLSGSYHYVKKLHSNRSLLTADEVQAQFLVSKNLPEKNKQPELEQEPLPLISLITVSFNRQETIEDTILSVKSQRYTNFEYIIIDGASTDDTLKIIKKYPQVVHDYVSESDKGIYDAMNKGIARAKGKIIGFINADDVLASPEVLENVAQAFAMNNIDACYADLVYVEQFNLMNIKRYWRSSAFKTGAFSRGWSPPHPTFYVKKSIYQRFGSFSLDYKLGNDIELMLRFLEKEQIRSLYVPSLWVKMRMGGVSNQSISNIVLQNKEIIKAARDNNIPFSIPAFIFFKLKSRFAQYFYK